MNSLYSRQEFLKSEKADKLRAELRAMVKNPLYNTHVRYSLVPSTGSRFVEKHILYMANHLNMNPDQYILNIKLMTKIR